MAPRKRRTTRLAVTTWKCNTCGELPAENFTKSELAYGNHRCKQCSRRRAAAYHVESPAVWVASESRARERKRLGDDAEVEFSAADAAAVLKRFDSKCCLSGASRKPLTIVPIDPRHPLSATNGAPVCRSIATLIRRDADAQNRLSGLLASSSV